MNKFITPPLRARRGWFKDDLADGDWFCQRTLEEYWEIPRRALCWLEVTKQETRGCYAIKLWLDCDDDCCIMVEFETDDRQYPIVESEAARRAAKTLRLGSKQKRFYVRLWTQEQ